MSTRDLGHDTTMTTKVPQKGSASALSNLNKKGGAGHASNKMGLGQALAMDSDEEDIVNMDDINEQKHDEPVRSESEGLPQFTYVRRSQRLSTVYRGKSDISL